MCLLVYVCVCVQQSICEKICSRPCAQTNTCTHKHTIPTCVMQIYWLSTGLSYTFIYAGTKAHIHKHTHIHTQAGTVCPAWQTATIQHPFIYPPTCPVSLHTFSPSLLFLLFSKGPSFFTSTKDQWASISGLSVDTGPQNEQPAGWINTDET